MTVRRRISEYLFTMCSIGPSYELSRNIVSPLLEINLLIIRQHVPEVIG